MLVIQLTTAAVQKFWEVTLSLAPKHINALRAEGINHPKDLAQFNSKEFEMVIRSMKGKAALPGLAQIRLKQACDFFQFIRATSRKMKNQYLTHDSIKSHAIQFQAFKGTDSKEVGGLSKLTESTDVLLWMDRTEKHLQKIPGRDFYHLVYLLQETDTAPETTVDLLPNKAYSVTHSSMIDKCVVRKSQLDTCAETDKVTLYGPLEFTLQPHESTKDGQAVIKEMYMQHGGRTKWENAHDSTMIQLKTMWNSSTGTKTLTNHIAAFRVNMVDIKRCYKRTGWSTPIEREQVLWLVGLIIATNPLLTAHIAGINDDSNGLGNNFEAAAMHLMLADPVEKHKVKGKRSGNPSISSALAGRGKTGVDLGWYNRDEFKQLDQAQKDELILWRSSAEGKAVILANKTKLKAKRNANKQKTGGEEGNKSSGGGGDDVAADKAKADKAAKKLQKNYPAAAAKAAKQLEASSMEAERAECAAADLFLEAAIKRRGGDPAAKISATSVIEDDYAVAEKDFTQNQTKLKLSAVKSRINKL